MALEALTLLLIIHLKYSQHSSWQLQSISF